MVVVGGFVSEDLICEQPGVYVFDTTSAKWMTSYTAGTTYTTPDVPEVVAVTGGRGTGTSTAGTGYAIGTGANDTDTSSQFPSNDGSDGDDSNSSSTGVIVGGVVGGILGGLLIAGLLFWWYRHRQHEQQAEAGASEKAGLGNSGSSGASPHSSDTRNPYDNAFASDDVEEQTAGYNAQFSRLVPRRTLRVVNA